MKKESEYDFVINLGDSLPEPQLPEQGEEPQFKAVDRKEDSPTSAEAREFVGGDWEIVNLRNGDQLIVNGDGRLTGLPVNEEASKLYYGWIVGNAIHLKGGAKWR